MKILVLRRARTDRKLVFQIMAYVEGVVKKGVNRPMYPYFGKSVVGRGNLLSDLYLSICWAVCGHL